MVRTNWKFISLIVIVLVTGTIALVEYRRIYVLSDRLGCVASWLDRAKTLHTLQMKESANFTGDTMRNLMDSVDWAYDCATKEPSLGHAPDAARSFGQYGVLPKE